jgi:hypothetical protein
VASRWLYSKMSDSTRSCPGLTISSRRSSATPSSWLELVQRQRNLTATAPTASSADPQKRRDTGRPREPPHRLPRYNRGPGSRSNAEAKVS